MWLINNQSMKLEEFTPPDVPAYAILSHTWEDDEITYQEFSNARIDKNKTGFVKIQKTCQLAKSKGFQYVWVDTCCIDKSSSAELSEAINSMFEWYRLSGVCSAYLSDLPASSTENSSTLWRDKEGRTCRWFRRGWTLQELLAPDNVEFYDSAWNFRGCKKDQSVMRRLFAMTGIRNPRVFLSSDAISKVPVGGRMSWASERKTKRLEDLAYCLLGIFQVNMPLIYGEGMRAFQRLQEEIIKTTTDMSLFCWKGRSKEARYRGLLAHSPAEFESYFTTVLLSRKSVGWSSLGSETEISVTNKGIRIDSQLCLESQLFLSGRRHQIAFLRCNIPPDDFAVLIRIQLYRDNVYVRVSPDEIFPLGRFTKMENKLIYIARSVDDRVIRNLDDDSDPVLSLNISLHPTRFILTGVKGWPEQPYGLSSFQTLGDYRFQLTSYTLNDKVTISFFIFRLSHEGNETDEFAVICQRNTSARQSLRYALVALKETGNILPKLEGSEEERNAVITVMERHIATGRQTVEIDYNGSKASLFISRYVLEVEPQPNSLYISIDNTDDLHNEIKSFLQRIKV